jgi:catechol 2,3-dioxygenase-like lactoylglutathione lyase family enzyme
MTVKHLDHLNMTVKNLAETSEWYHRVFGFEIVETGTWSGVPWAIIQSGDAMLCIYEHPELVPIGDGAPSHHINHFGLRITDRDQWEETLKRESIPVHYGPYRWPHSTAWYISDPTGYEIEVALWDNDRVTFDRAPVARAATGR